MGGTRWQGQLRHGEAGPSRYIGTNQQLIFFFLDKGREKEVPKRWGGNSCDRNKQLEGFFPVQIREGSV